MTTETLREALARLYPLHFQRIMEIAGPDRVSQLDSDPTYDLARSFTWNETEEGHQYWWRLSRAEDCPFTDADDPIQVARDGY